MVWLLPSSQSSGSCRHIRHFINSEHSRFCHAYCTTLSYSCWSGLHTFPIQLRGECCFFAYFFFLHSTSNLTYCLRKRTLGVRASWLGSHEHSVAHEMWVVGSLRPQLIIYIPIHPFSRQGLTNYFLRVCLFLFVWVLAWMYVCNYLCAWCPRKPKVIGTPGPGVTL